MSNPYQLFNELKLPNARSKILALSSAPTSFVSCIAEAADVVKWQLMAFVNDWPNMDTTEARNAKTYIFALLEDKDYINGITRSMLGNPTWATAYLDWLASVHTRLEEARRGYKYNVTTVLREEFGHDVHYDIVTIKGYIDARNTIRSADSGTTAHGS